MRERLRPAVAAAVGLGRRTLWRRHVEQVPGSGDVVGAAAIGEEAVVADAVEAVGQEVDQEARMNSSTASLMTLYRSARLAR